MTAIKICGIKQAETLQLLNQLQVDYAGFVFAPSKRQVTAEQVAQLLTEVSEYPQLVGVFVNPTLAELETVLASVPLQLIQLHGQETPLFCQEVRNRFGLQVWKAISMDEQGGLPADLDSYQRVVDAMLFDTYDPAVAGGTGRRFSWSELPRIGRELGSYHYFVAGGINEHNVEELLRLYRPPGIDVSSGVETNSVKDHEKIRRFIERVKVHE